MWLILMKWNMSRSISATLSFEAVVLQGRCRPERRSQLEIVERV
jgi:hypothetical protein